MSMQKKMFMLKYGKDEHKHDIINDILDDPMNSQSDVRRVSSTIMKIDNPEPRIFEIMIKHPRARLNYNMREVLSYHPKTPKHIIDHMLNDERYDEQWTGIANREDVTPEQLTKIAVHGIGHDNQTRVNEQAGRAALEHPKAPMELLDKFSHHPDPYVSAAVAYNQKATKEHLLRIAENHPYDAGGEVARSRLKHKFNHIV